MGLSGQPASPLVGQAWADVCGIDVAARQPAQLAIPDPNTPPPVSVLDRLIHHCHTVVTNDDSNAASPNLKDEPDSIWLFKPEVGVGRVRRR